MYFKDHLRIGGTVGTPLSKMVCYFYLFFTQCSGSRNGKECIFLCAAGVFRLQVAFVFFIFRVDGNVHIDG